MVARCGKITMILTIWLELKGKDSDFVLAVSQKIHCTYDRGLVNLISRTKSDLVHFPFSKHKASRCLVEVQLVVEIRCQLEVCVACSF